MRNLAESLYHEIRTGIIEGRYKPRERLVEKDLAEDMAASRTPVRQALQRLELDGLVTSSRHGWIIREHTVQDIENIYDLRLAIEGYASWLAAKRGNAAALDRIKRAHHALHESEIALTNQESDDRQPFVLHHDAFHDAIFKAAGSPLLEEAIVRYRHHPYNRRIAHLYSLDELARISTSHTEISIAIIDRNADEAESVTREHLRIAMEITVARIRGSLMGPTEQLQDV